LIIVAFDANNEIFLLAFAIIDEKIILIEDGFCFVYKDTLPMIEHIFI